MSEAATCQKVGYMEAKKGPMRGPWVPQMKMAVSLMKEGHAPSVTSIQS